jgi:hypothetical protein
MSSKRFGIHSLLPFCLVISSCREFQQFHIDKLNSNEYIWCSTHGNSVPFGDDDTISFRIRIKEMSDERSSWNMNSSTPLSVEVRGAPRLSSHKSIDDYTLIHKYLVVGDEFAYLSTRWKILKIGTHGVKVVQDKYPRCSGGFLYIQRIK